VWDGERERMISLKQFCGSENIDFVSGSGSNLPGHYGSRLQISGDFGSGYGSRSYSYIFL